MAARERAKAGGGMSDPTVLCPKCQGRGYVITLYGGPLGYYECQTYCWCCRGTGHVSIHHVCWWHRIGAAWRAAKEHLRWGKF